jgi:hypothetical protein
VCDAATAHWLRISLSQRLPLVVLPERRLPPVMLLPGHMPAHDARCAAVGNRVMSTPIIEFCKACSKQQVAVPGRPPSVNL